MVAYWLRKHLKRSYVKSYTYLGHFAITDLYRNWGVLMGLIGYFTKILTCTKFTKDVAKSDPTSHAMV